MKQIKIANHFWNEIVVGLKEYEFRKLGKGLPSGIYEFVSVDYECSCGTNNINILGTGIDKTTGKEVCIYCGKSNFWPRKIYGTAHLNPIAVNPRTKPYFNGYAFATGGIESIREIDKSSYEFVKNNYINNDVDFVVYIITNVKVHNG